MRVAGALDTVTAPGFRHNLEQAVISGAQLIVVDMAAVTFLDSAGLAVLFGVHRGLLRDQQLALANIPTVMQRALQITGLHTLLQVHQQDQPWPWPDLPQHRDTETP